MYGRPKWALGFKIVSLSFDIGICLDLKRVQSQSTIWNWVCELSQHGYTISGMPRTT